MAMRIVADENIPHVRHFFERFGEVVTRPGRRISADDVREADVLVVRSVTRVDKDLLLGSRVRFVGTCTIGVDHLDTQFLDQQGIGYASAPGCNANSVVEYVFSALAQLRPQWLSLSFAVVGCGNVGGALYRRLKALGLEVSFYDPLIDVAARQDLDPSDAVSLRTALQADVVCLHAPLTRSGEHPSWHLLGEAELAQLKPGCLLLNAGRGPVIDNQALRKCLQRRNDINVVLDVWEPEPEIDLALLPLVDLATPHIAGYSYDGKVAGTEMIYQSVCRFLGLDVVERDESLLQGGGQIVTLADQPLQECLNQAILSGFDIAGDDRRMRAALAGLDTVGGVFDQLRKDYPKRREFFVNQVVLGDGHNDQDRLQLQQALALLGFAVTK